MTDALLISALPVTTSDRLRVRAWNPSLSVSPTIFLRYLLRLKDGSLVQSSESLLIPAGSIDLNFVFPLAAGNLLWCSVDNGSTSLQDGAVFTAIAIQNGSVNQPQNVIQLTSGYIATGRPVNYPLSPPQAANDTPSNYVSLSIANPGAGVTIDTDLDQTAFIKLLNLRTTFTTDANIALRLPYLTARDTTGISYTSAVNATIAASTVATLSFAIWPTTPFPITNGRYGVIPDHQTSAGTKVLVDVENLQVGDAFTSTRVRYLSKVIG